MRFTSPVFESGHSRVISGDAAFSLIIVFIVLKDLIVNNVRPRACVRPQAAVGAIFNFQFA
jgi:hypothetical protein